MAHAKKSAGLSRRGAHVSKTGEWVNLAEAEASSLRLVGGRLIGRSLADPDVKKKMQDRKEALRKDPAKLQELYVKRGILTKGGHLTKAFRSA